MNMEKDLLNSELMGSTARFPYSIYTSASRLMMAALQDGGKLTMAHPEPSLNPSGLEEEFAEGTFRKEIEGDVEIISVIPIETIGDPWSVTILFRDLDTGILDEITIPRYHSLYNKYGFLYKISPDLANLQKGKVIRGGMILADSPSVQDGDYNPGVNLNVAVCSVPGVAEDGIVFNSDTLWKSEFDSIRSMSIKIGPEEVPVPAYSHYQEGNVIPEPGQLVRDDLILAAIRKKDPLVFPAQLTPRAMSRINSTDRLHQLSGAWKTEVLSVEVIKNTPENGIPQLDRLAKAMDTYYAALLREYRLLRRSVASENKKLVVSPSLSYLLTRAEVLTSTSRRSKDKTKLEMRQEPLPPYTINIVTSQRMQLSEAGKLSDGSSAKGVTVEIWPPERMPLAADGTRADVCMSKEASLNRMIMGRDLQLASGQAVVQAGKMFTSTLGINPKLSPNKQKRAIQKMMRDKDPRLSKALNLLLEFYGYMSKDVAESLKDGIISKDINSIGPLVLLVLKYGAICPQPIDYLVKYPLWKSLLKIDASKFKTHKGPVSYVNYKGEHITTKESIRIGPVYFSFLEKVGSEISVAYSARSQINGFYAVNNKADKEVSPIAHTNVRSVGTDEAPVMPAAMGPVFTAEFIDRLTSPEAHCAETMAMLENEKPTAQNNLIDRTQLPYGSSTARRMFNSILAVFGTVLEFKPEEK